MTTIKDQVELQASGVADPASVYIGVDKVDQIPNVSRKMNLSEAMRAARYETETFREVEEFGAVGDGVTDDTAAFMAAFTVGLNGPTILLGKKTYNLASWTPFDVTDKSLHVIGKGATLVGPGFSGQDFLRYIGSADVFFEDVNLTDFFAGFNYDAGGAGLATFRAHRVNFNNVQLPTGSTGATSVKLFEMDGCDVTGFGESGIRFQASGSGVVRILNNVVHDVNTATFSHGIIIEAPPGGNNRGIFIRNNAVYNCIRTAAGADIFGILVNDGGKAVIANNTVENVYSTVQAVADIGSHGIYAQGSGTNIVMGNALKNAGQFQGGIVLKSADANLNICSHNTIYYTATVPFQAVGINDFSQNCQIRGNVIVNEGGNCHTGIIAQGGTFADKTTLIEGNIVVGMKASGVQQATGIGINASENTEIHNNIFKDFEITASSVNFGITLNGNCSKVVIHGNQFEEVSSGSGNQCWMVYLNGGLGQTVSTLSVRDNVFKGFSRAINKPAGPSIDELIVTGNYFEGGSTANIGTYGIVLTDNVGKAHIDGNTFCNLNGLPQESYAIYLDSAANAINNVSVTNNMIQDMPNVAGQNSSMVVINNVQPVQKYNISNNTFNDGYSAIYFTNAGTITKSVITGNVGADLALGLFENLAGPAASLAIQRNYHDGILVP